jgi:hypothetical protein
MTNIRDYVLIWLLSLPVLSFGQGYGVSSEFYIKRVSKKNEINNEYWEKQIKKLSRKYSKDSLNPEILYGLAITKSRVFDSRDAQESIDLLNKAIAIDNSKAKYYAVRGIIKYDWGVWSKEYSPNDGCNDIKKALEIGFEPKLQKNDAIIGILYHPDCK